MILLKTCSPGVIYTRVHKAYVRTCTCYGPGHDKMFLDNKQFHASELACIAGQPSRVFYSLSRMSARGRLHCSWPTMA